MTDAQARDILERVQEKIQPHELVVNRAAFQEVVQEVRDSASFAALPATQLELEMVVAMCLLGPTRAGAPPRDQRAALLAQIMRSSSDCAVRHDRLPDIAIAFGCGNWRQVTHGEKDTWRAVWAGAQAALARYAATHVKEADAFVKRIVDMPVKSRFPRGAIFEQYAHQLIAWLLISPTKEESLAAAEALTIFHEHGDTLVLREPAAEVTAKRRPGARLVFTVGPGGAGREWGDHARLPEGTEIVITAEDKRVHVAAFDRIGDERISISHGGTKLPAAQYAKSESDKYRDRDFTWVSKTGNVKLHVGNLTTHVHLRSADEQCLDGLCNRVNASKGGATAQVISTDDERAQYYMSLKANLPGERPIRLLDGSVDLVPQKDPGGKVARLLGPVQLTVCRCHCGNEHCLNRHRLSGWAPDADPYVSLTEFVRRAVYGGLKSLMADAFARGIYGPLLNDVGVCIETVRDDGVVIRRDGHLRLAEVLHRVCTKCNPRNQYYKENQCPRCGTPFDPKWMPMAHERRLILNMDPPLFQTEEYFHCSSCDNLYETTNAGCPCGAGPPRDTTTVWVWAPVRHVELVDG